MTRFISDINERLAALETSQSCHVEAPAGSGKTHLLTSRFLKLLGEVNHPQEILALTFTKKAAGEMRSRVIGTFLRTVNDTPPHDSDDAFHLELARVALQKHGRHRSLLFSIDGLNIMTFHSFCYHISKRAPLESSLPPDFNIIEENAQPGLILETLDRLRRRIFKLRRNHPSRQAFEKRLLYNNNRWSRFENEMKGVILNRDRFEYLIHEVARHGLSSLPVILKSRLGEHVEMFLGRLSNAFPGCSIGLHWEPFIRDLSLHGAEASSMMTAFLPGVSWKSLPDWQAIASRLLTKDGSPRKRFGPHEGFYKHFSSTPWFKMISELPRQTAELLDKTRKYPLVEDSIPDLDDLKDFIILSSELLSEYDGLCRICRVIDFAALEQSALRALNGDSPTDIQLYLDVRIKHLLVDEFQDTSLNQWELIKRLMSGWEPGDGRTVFLVGDPKQSIYGFRNAEVHLFLQAKSGIPITGVGTLPVRNLSLATNFRSAPILIDWINGLFGEVVMSSPKEEFDEASFSPSASSGKEVTGSPSLSLHLFSSGDAERSKDDEAKWLAARIYEVMNDRGSQTSVAVLLFNRNRLNHYLKALKDANLPVQVQEGLPLSERPEIRHLLQIARAVTRPHDDLAWASLLRSPWFWCDLNTLHEMSLKDASGWRERLYAMCSSHPSFKTLLQSLNHALQRTGRDSLGQVVRIFWESLDGPRVTASLYGMAGVANCLRFFEMMDRVEEGVPQLTLCRLERMLSTLYEPPDPTMSRAMLQMMTVHRAKGLEFDVVFLPYLDWRPLASGPKSFPPYLLERLPGADGKSLLAMGPDSRQREPTSVFRILNSLRRERSWGEAKRLFYVAATRARTSLFMSGIMENARDVFHASDKSVLRWVLDYEGLSDNPLNAGIHGSGSSLHVCINPSHEKGSPRQQPDELLLPEPYPFEPERIPYRIQNPSALERDPYPVFFESFKDGSLTGSTEASAAGTVIYRMINTCIHGGGLPSHKAIAIALRAEGVPENSAFRLAGEILEEVRAAMEDPFIKSLSSEKNPFFKSEWGIDEPAGAKILRSGTLDFVTFDGKSWWIIDFKTSRPFTRESTADFIARQVSLHRPQLTAYRSMLASLQSTPFRDIHAGIYFTHLRLWHEVG